MEEDNKILNYRGLSHLIEKLKAFFIKNPKQRDAGKYLRCIDSDGNVEWASLPSFVNLIDGFDPTSLIIGGISGRTLTTEAEVRGDCYIATAAGTLFPGTVSAITLEAGDSIIFRKDVAAGISITANDIIYIESSVTVSPGTSILAWNTEITLATVEGVDIKAKLPANPNTDTQADWTESNSSSPAYINHKPIIPTVNDATVVFSALGNNSDKFAQFTLNQGSDTEIIIKEGANIKLCPDLSSNQLVIEAVDTTYGDFAGSSHGLVPASASGDSTKFLKGDGTWATPSGTGLTGVSFNGTSATVSGGIAAITANVGDVNVIETVKVNGTTLTPDANKAVDVTDTHQSIATSNNKMYLTGVEDNSGIPTGAQTGVANSGVYAKNGYLYLNGNIGHNLETYPSDPTLNYTSVPSDPINISYGSKKYILINVAFEGNTPLIINLSEYSNSFEGVREIVCRVHNRATNNMFPRIKVTCDQNVSLTNMYNLDIINTNLQVSGNNRTLELVFTFWGANDVTFNGGLSL